MRFRRKRTNDTSREIDKIEERWQIDVRRADAVMADESIPIEQRVAMAQAILLGPTRYARRPSGGYFG